MAVRSSVNGGYAHAFGRRLRPLYRRIFCEMWERCTDHKIDSLEYQPDSLAIQTDFWGLKETACADSSGILLGVANREPKRSPAIIRRSYIDAY